MGIQGEFFERPAVRVAVTMEDRSADDRSSTQELKMEERNSFAAGPVATSGNGSSNGTHAPTKRSMKDLTIPKLYYSISEVSRLSGIEPYVLRYWEAEFDELKPQKNRAGNRVYSNKDIKFILRIKELLREKRYTIEGAKHILKSEHVAAGDAALHEEPVAISSDPSQIALPTETKVAAPPPQAMLTLDEIRSMKDALLSLKALLRKN
jgi:DNA-binding transcriptional MerR regulator